MSKENKIIESWSANAAAWIKTIDTCAIESRKLITNKAIIDAVTNSKPSSILDVGCGEGWLAFELKKRGISVTGVDAIPALIESAKQKVKGDFFVATYEDMADGKINFTNLFDAIVINFALIGKESTENLLKALPRFLAPNGKLIIQTLHPYSRKIIDDYFTGWKVGSWDGLGEEFIKPYEWYFRTMEDWMELLFNSGFLKKTITDILHPENGKPLSVIFTCDSSKSRH